VDKIVHPKYNFFTYEYDLALVKLERRITFQENMIPICLPGNDDNLVGKDEQRIPQYNCYVIMFDVYFTRKWIPLFENQPNCEIRGCRG